MFLDWGSNVEASSEVTVCGPPWSSSNCHSTVSPTLAVAGVGTYFPVLVGSYSTLIVSAALGFGGVPPPPPPPAPSLLLPQAASATAKRPTPNVLESRVKTNEISLIRIRNGQVGL